MRSNDVVESARLAGARRRAVDEGREPPPEPAVTAPPPPHPTMATMPPPAAHGAASAASAASTASAAGAGASAARGPWFDARAVFLGWLAMIAALVAGASGPLVAAAGFGAAYLLARRGRLANAVVSVVGATVTVLVLVTALFVAASVFGT